ncbi:MAG: hypothetical protein KAT66_00830 [Candidatus Lokiarchaeota archaeon]|nr:hypothetical protein [Candidatus Lokiarchaeota archaeon]
MSRHEFTAGEELDSDKLNKNIIAGSYDAGETVAGATLPVPAYQDTSDNEFYKCDANDTDKLEFVGFIISDGNDGDAVDIQFNGIVKGFIGLDEGEKYYVQDAVGTIGKTPGTVVILVGIAISATELLILKETSHTNGQTTYDLATASGVQNIPHGLGKIPKKIKLTAMWGSAYTQQIFSIGVYNRKTNSHVRYGGDGGSNAVVASGNNTNGIYIATTAANNQAGIITVDATNIIITWTKTGNPTLSAYILWEAEG